MQGWNPDLPDMGLVLCMGHALNTTCTALKHWLSANAVWDVLRKCANPNHTVTHTWPDSPRWAGLHSWQGLLNSGDAARPSPVEESAALKSHSTAGMQGKCNRHDSTREALFYQHAQLNTEVLPYRLEKEKEKWLPLDESFIPSVGGIECIIPGRGLSAARV
ncbi:UNVERIFIED_CONTAM: hypothetical protein FKN15_026672 [Acipenser sinensis]